MKIGTVPNAGQGHAAPRLRDVLRRPQGNWMIELLRTNDMVLLSYVRALLAGERIKAVGLDEHMSMLDGNVAAIPQRLMVDDRDAERARQLLKDANLGHILQR